MFPNINWYLVDPRKDKNGNSVFDKRLYTNKKIKLIKEEYFSDKLAKEMLPTLNKHFFLYISDIREFHADTREDGENDINADMKYQLNWYKILNPDYSQLKFRIPYNETKYNYVDGIIYLQQYAPKSSTETRLVVKKNAKMKTYDANKYNGRLWYFNRLLRTSYYKHTYNILNIDHCYDCSYFLKLIEEYNKYNSNFFKNKSIEEIINIIYNNLKTKNSLKIKTKEILENIIN